MNTQKLYLVLLLSLALAYSSLAFGVTSPYWDTKPLGLHPGESADVQLLLQNMIGDKDITLIGGVTEGAELATLINENTKYVIPFGTKDLPVMVRISVPEDAEVGKQHNVKVSFTQVAGNDAEGKMIQMKAGVGAIIPVVVTPWVAPKESSVSTTTLALGGAGLLLVGGIVTAWVVRKRRMEQNQFPDPPLMTEKHEKR